MKYVVESLGENQWHTNGDALFTPSPTLSEVIRSLGCRRNSSSGSVLIRQLTEAQLTGSGLDWSAALRQWTVFACYNSYLLTLALDTVIRMWAIIPYA